MAHLRTETARRPHDAVLAAHTGELAAASADFRRLWGTQFTFDTSRAPSRLSCPALGTTLHLSWEAFRPTDDPDEWMVVYTAAEGSASADALRRLAAHATVAGPSRESVPVALGVPQRVEGRGPRDIGTPRFEVP
ncbi:hypothetical protein GCM10020221_21570 [Streptomyces thioluteus]|uniref:MmyB-like transcription regulator ligand binding domain-containing protein n=1 Tax=Streptomyces thioluteus TaxID=66431 RepID=A0ABN3WTQ7_STRTU